MSYQERSTFFNAVTKRYEISVPIQAYTVGSGGNVNVGTIVQNVSGADPRLKVTNTSPTTGGSDLESNLLLANRSMLAIAGVDSGTEGGYALTTLGIGGVRSVRVHQAGDPLMLRDIDPTTGEHLGGKVDIYVQGQHPIQWQDTLAFSYSGPLGDGMGDRFYVNDAVNFMLTTNNPNVTPATPIFEVLRVTNVTKSLEYDTAGVVVGLGAGDSIQLAQNTVNLTVGMATLDVIEVDYRYRGSNVYVLNNQPVDEVLSVTGDIDGVLPPENYNLVKLQDPLKEGNSTISKDGVEVNYFNGYPTDSTRQITAETHYFLSTEPIKLAVMGVDTDTLVVSADSQGVLAYVRGTDYSVGKGGDKNYTYLYLESFSKIRNGSLVYVSYTAAQNFTVVYTSNNTLKQVQTAVNQSRHAAADVIVKNTIQNYVDIAIQIIRKRGFNADTISNQIKTTLGNAVNNLKVSQPLMVDDVIKMVKDINGVKTVVLPILKMMKKNGSFIPSDYLGSVNFKAYNENAGQGVTSFISTTPVLAYGTVDTGGIPSLFKAIYEGTQALVMADTPLAVSLGQGRGYIMSDGRILVTTLDGAPPQTKEYTAAYYTYVAPESEFSSDIMVDSIESLAVDSDSITVDASTEESSSRQGT